MPAPSRSFTMSTTGSSTVSLCACSPIAGVAEDVTQGIFLKLWSNPDSFVSGNFGAWIVRVARNRALDVLRSRAAHPEGEVPESMPAEDSLEDTALARIDAESVRNAIAKLPAGTARTDRARLFRRRDPSRDRALDGFAVGHGQDANSKWITAPARRARRSGRRMTSHDEMLDNVAVYALGVLPPAEAQVVAEHLQTLRGVPARIRSSCGRR